MFEASTTVSVDGTRFAINGQPTYRGRGPAEGLLFNIRTVNATFDDTLGAVRWWDDDGSQAGNGYAGYGAWRSPQSAEENTARYVRALPAYRAHGILAVNLNVQGGHPLNGKPWIGEGRGSAGARPNGHRDYYHNSGFLPDGSLDPDYAARLRTVIEACDRLGMVVILQLFYFGQDTVFSHEGQIERAVDCAVDWICERGYRNVILEIANETMAGHYHHEILKPSRTAELIARARRRGAAVHDRVLLVTTSEAALLNPRQWTPAEIDTVLQACDVIVIHGGDNVETGRVGDASDLVAKVELIRARPWFQHAPRPILSNEAHGAACFEALLARGVSFGLHSIVFQTMFPPRWGVWENETSWFFERVRTLTQR